MTAKYSPCVLAVVMCWWGSIGTTKAADDAWLTDFEKAKRISLEEGKPILADFTGSDWCGWCIKLDKEVFSTQEFRDFAQDSVVLFVADFPRGKPQSKVVIQQNEELRRKYGIKGLPTVLLLDDRGEVIGHVGYRPGGPVKYVEELRKIVSVYGTKTVVDEVQPEAVSVEEAKAPESTKFFSLGKWFRSLFE